MVLCGTDRVQFGVEKGLLIGVAQVAPDEFSGN